MEVVITNIDKYDRIITVKITFSNISKIISTYVDCDIDIGLSLKFKKELIK